MREPYLEPGLLQTFRFLTGIRLALTLLTLCSQSSTPTPGAIPSFPILNTLETGFLMVFLALPWLRRLLGKLYLPSALFIATVGPLAAHTMTVWGRMSIGYGAQDAFGDGGQVLLSLLIPVVLLSSQYSLKTLIGYWIGTAALQIVLASPAAKAGGPDLKLTTNLVFISTVFYMLVGYVVVRLISAQRAQRRELAQTNTKLAEYAETLEQLAVSRERNRMARELHDTLAHTLSAVAIQLEALDTLWDADPQAARRTLAISRDLTRSGLLETRRALNALRASPLEDLGLALAIRHLAETTAARVGLKLSLDIQYELGQLPAFAEQSLYRIAEETLNNTARHANASHVEVSLRSSAGHVALSVADDGRGFEPSQLSLDKHYGLVGMQERAALCNGVLNIDSTPGKGTNIRLILEENQ